MIKFIAHTEREFATERDFQDFMHYLWQSKSIPPPMLKQIDEIGYGEINSADGVNGDCPCRTIWRVEGRSGVPV